MKFMAEREGFEPPIPVKVWPLSRRLVSTTHAPLRINGSRIVGSRSVFDGRGDQSSTFSLTNGTMF
jgi:hypothetical protein